MIHFKELELKNFISVGDNPINIILDRSPTTLISGSNGSGKTSIICDGVTFALFGRSFRGVTKAQLINTINQRDSYTKISFTARGSEYTIIRGQKPTRLEIIKDGQLLNEDASVADAQNALERNILGFDYTTFIRVCILSTMNHVPFMQLSANERRNFVENMLSLKAYGDMNKLHRANVSIAKDESIDLERSTEVLKAELREKNNTLKLLRALDSEQSQKVKEDALILVQKIEDITEKIENLSKSALSLQDKSVDDEAEKKVRELGRLIAYTISERRVLENRQVGIVHKNDCDTCLQEITDAHKESIQKSFGEKIKVLNDDIRQLENKLGTAQEAANKLEEINVAKREIANNISILESERKGIKIQLKSKLAEKDVRDESKIVEVISDIRRLEYQLKAKSAAYNELTDRLVVLGTVSNILKDTGIKASIIKQYIPMLVNYVNHYLDKLNINATFNMDENFNDSITTRYANEYTYANLSAGERARIDLAISFAWRQIALVKGSAFCNLLVLDEIADASLDINGTEDLMSILSLMDDANVFIISHKGNIEEHVRSTLNLEKRNGFTKIVG